MNEWIFGDREVNLQIEICQYYRRIHTLLYPNISTSNKYCQKFDYIDCQFLDKFAKFNARKYFRIYNMQFLCDASTTSHSFYTLAAIISRDRHYTYSLHIPSQQKLPPSLLWHFFLYIHILPASEHM